MMLSTNTKDDSGPRDGSEASVDAEKRGPLQIELEPDSTRTIVSLRVCFEPADIFPEPLSIAARVHGNKRETRMRAKP